MTAETKKTLAEFWWLFLLHGIATAVLGLLLVTAPGITMLTLVTFLGVYWLIGGIFSIVWIFVGDSRTHWVWSLLSGILGILAGILVLNHPLLSTLLIPTTLVIILAVQGIVIGVFRIIQGFQEGGWGGIVWGGINIVIGLILLGSPLLAATVLPVVIGAFSLVGGVVLIFNSFQLRKA